jgi:transposase
VHSIPVDSLSDVVYRPVGIRMIPHSIINLASGHSYPLQLVRTLCARYAVSTLINSKLKELARKEGIEIEPTAPYSHSQNGVAE